MERERDEDRERVAVIVPVGSLDRAKSRLGESLDAEERHDLVERSLQRTITAAIETDAFADVLVVSPDPEVRSLAVAAGARTLRQHSNGLNAGLDEAREDVVAGGAEAIVVLPIDLPFVTPGAIGDVVAALSNGAGDPASAAVGAAVGVRRVVVLVTDRHGTGTNALALRPPDVIDFAFGVGSRAAHRAAAERAGAVFVEVEGPLAIDLDTPDDLVLVQARAAETRRAG